MTRALVAIAVALSISAPVSVVQAQPGRVRSVQTRAGKIDIPPCQGETNGAPIIELWTVGKGDLFVEKFGHAALCVCWPTKPKRDICYNYGTTNFGAPASLTWGFLRGSAEFWVEPWPRWKMLAHYKIKDRSLYLQTFDDKVLSAEKRKAMQAKLEFDVLEENKYYRYHHFYDNCTTRVRDILNDAFDGVLKKDSDGAPGLTFRHYGAQGFAEQTWILAAGDFFAGRDVDIAPTEWQLMFHPDFLRAAVEEDVGVQARLIYARQGREFSDDYGCMGRGWTIMLAFLIGFPAVFTRLRRRRQRLGLVLTTLPLGLIGFLLWFVAIIATLGELRYNEALFLFLPTDWLIPFLGPERRRKYARVRVGMVAVVSVLVAVGLFKQPLWIPFLWVLPVLLVAMFSVPDREVASDAKDDSKTAKKSQPAKKSKAARRLQRAAK